MVKYTMCNCYYASSPEDITFETVREQQHPAIHTDALIECRVSGQPAPEVSWRYRGQKVRVGTYTRNYLVTVNSGRLVTLEY